MINQHYVPQFVLSHFSDNRKKVSEALLDERKIYKTNYSRSMSERNTYEHPLLEINELEKIFGDIESDFAPAIKEMISLLDENEEETNNLEKVKSIIESYLSTIIIFYYRSGALLHEFSIENLQKGIRIDHLLEKLSNKRYINKLGDTIKNYYNFGIIKSENNEFLLSDQYLSTAALAIKSRFLNISNRQIGLRDVILLIPISSKYYVVYYEGSKPEYIQKDKISILSEKQVDDINKVIINNSYVKCIGFSEEALQRAIRHFKHGSVLSTYAEFNSGSMSGATLKKEVFFYERDIIAWNEFIEGNWFPYKDLGRNELCKCGSGKKLKNCCIETFLIIKKMMATFRNKDIHLKVRPHPTAITEYSVTEFFSRKY